MSQSIAYKHYLRALSRFPKDPLRPESQFQDAIRRRVDRRFLPAANSATNAGPGTAAVAGSPVDEKVELGQVNALYSLLEDRYKTKYPLSEKLMRPTGNPTYYEDLVKELQEAPTRTWFGRKLNSWKGFLRFK